jgi:sodium-dependent dicarboxylate transporter 2/3/5
MSRSRLTAQLAGPLGAGLVFLLAPYFGWSDAAIAVLAASCWMLIWWVSEAVPIAVTSVLPIVLFPLFGIASVGETTAPYGSHYVFLFMGGFLIAIALENWSLHRRFALNILAAAGGNPRRLIGGFMLATALLSMWISNTATTLMMLPIALSVITKLNLKQHPNFAVALLLGTAYAANIGGMATLVGTPPNVALAGIMEEQYEVVIPFMEWMLLASPFSALLLLLVYVFLTRVLLPIAKEGIGSETQPIRDELMALGGWSKAERRVGTVFGLTAFLWISRRALEDLTGWPLNDTTIAMAAGISLFLIPSGEENRPLMRWEEARRLPWDILLLFGGGLTLAGALGRAGILEVVANVLSNQGAWPLWLMIGAFAFVALMLTEVMSNLALTVVMVPVVALVGLQLGLNPLMLSIPVALASSCAFMLPMATPPNAIIFGSNQIRMGQMARVGFVLNLIAAILVVLWSAFVLPVWLEML